MMPGAPACMQEDDCLALRDVAALDHLQKPRETLAGIARIENQRLALSHQIHRFADFLARVIVSAAVVLVCQIKAGGGDFLRLGRIQMIECAYLVEIVLGVSRRPFGFGEIPIPVRRSGRFSRKIPVKSPM